MSSRWDPIALYNRRRLLAEPGGERMLPGSLGGIGVIDLLAQPNFPAEPTETQRRPAREEPAPEAADEVVEPDPPMCADCLSAGSRDGTPLVAGRHAA